MTNDDLSVHKVLISCAKWTKRINEKSKNHQSRNWVLFSDMSSYFPSHLAKNMTLFRKRLQYCHCVRLSWCPLVSCLSLSFLWEYDIGPIGPETTCRCTGVDLKFDHLIHLIVRPQYFVRISADRCFRRNSSSHPHIHKNSYNS